jgi:hypothetical protein
MPSRIDLLSKTSVMWSQHLKKKGNGNEGWDDKIRKTGVMEGTIKTEENQ